MIFVNFFYYKIYAHFFIQLFVEKLKKNKKDRGECVKSKGKNKNRLTSIDNSHGHLVL